MMTKLSMALLLLLLAISAAPALSQEVEAIPPTDDAYVMVDLSGSPAGAVLSALNTGRAPYLIAGYYFNESGEGEFVLNVAFLKFDLSGYEGITSAVLTLTVSDIVSRVPPVLQVYYVEDDSWTEETVTYNTAPPPGKLLGEVTIDGTGRVSLDLTGVASKDEVITIALICKQVQSPSSTITINSKEAESGGPLLIVKYERPQPIHIYLAALAAGIVIAIIAFTRLRRR